MVIRNSLGLAAWLLFGFGALKAGMAQDRLPTHFQQISPIPFASGTFGHNIENVGDLNNDGFEDYAVAAKNFLVPGGNLGRVFVYSGRDASLLRTFDGIQIGAQFGASIQEVGDVNGDGIRDICVGAPDYDDPINGNNAGRIACFSGATGAEIWSIVGEIGSGGNLGVSMCVISDGTLTGATALVAGEPKYAGVISGGGRVVYYSVTTGLLLDTENGVIGFDSLGKTLASRPGMTGLYSGSGGGRVWTLNGPGSMDSPTLFNSSTGGSVDAPELALLKGPTNATSGLIIGRRFADTNGFINNGEVTFHPGGSLTPTLTLRGTFLNENFGFKVVAVRDQDGDGIEEVGFASAPVAGFTDSRFRVFTLAGVKIDDYTTIGGASADYASIHDTTGDGRGEILESVANGNTGLFVGLMLAKGHSFDSLTVLPGAINQFRYNVDVGPINSGKTFFQLYSLSGPYPGFVFSPGDPIVPLIPDATTELVLGLAGSVFYPDAIGIADGFGLAQTHAFVDAATAAVISGFIVNTVVLVFDFPSQRVLATTNPVVVVMP